MKCTIRLDYLKACALVASTEETRYYLNGILFSADKTGVEYVATDGHRLLACHAELGDDDETVPAVIIPAAVVASFKAKDLRQPVAVIEVTGQAPAYACTITLSDGRSVGFKPIDGPFPDWRRVIPAAVDGKPAQYNAAYLESFRKAGELLGCKMPEVLYNGIGPAVVRWGDDSFFGVLMPHRGAAPETALPAWVNPTVAQDKAA